MTNKDIIVEVRIHYKRCIGKDSWDKYGFYSSKMAALQAIVDFKKTYALKFGIDACDDLVVECKDIVLNRGIDIFLLLIIPCQEARSYGKSCH